ncbi:hypothetical protein D3C84_1233920 [compost metagenome]
MRNATAGVECFAEISRLTVENLLLGATASVKVLAVPLVENQAGRDIALNVRGRQVHRIP